MRLVLDWDGTVTEVDSLHMVLERFGDPGVYARAEEELGRELTLHEVIAVEFSSVRAPLEEVVAWMLEHVRVRPGFRELAAAYRPLIVSSGFRELIEPILEREAVALSGSEPQSSGQVQLLANRLDPRPDGWRVRWRDESQCDVCGEACKRGGLPDGEVVYVGDGYSDRCAALAADRVFATDGLAAYLERQGLPYEPFTDFSDLARSLGGR